MDVQVKALVLNQIVTQWLVENPNKYFILHCMSCAGLLQEVEAKRTHLDV